MTMATKDIRRFLAAFPDRRVWIDGEARRAEGEWNGAAYADELIEEDDQELIPQRIDTDVVQPMLLDVAAYLGVESVNAYQDCNTGDDFEFEALGCGFLVSIYHYDIHGRRLDVGRDRAVRVVVRLEPDPQWDEDNEDNPLVMAPVY